MLCRNSIVHIVVFEELVSRLDEEELQNAFQDDLLEDTALLGVGKSWRERRGGGGGGFKWGRGDELLERSYDRSSEPMEMQA